MSKIIVGMSGGVDSSVVAKILKDQGHEVIGLYMKNWDETDPNGNCTSESEYQDVVKVCEQIDIDYYSVNFVKEYWDNVFKEFLDDYQNGFTPNPDVLCNKEIKFKVFFNKAMELGADYLATGHYCQNLKIDNINYLCKGKDPLKDQSYFLHAISGDVLAKVLFPIGHLSKVEVRKLAEEFNLATKTKKDSTGICFIGERNFKPFLKKYISSSKGLFKNLDGTVVGEHDGFPFYTLGQRKGLGLGGPGERWFVVSTDKDTNTVYVERGKDHPALFSNYLIASDLHLINNDFKITFPFKCTCKIRYRQTDQDCIISKDKSNRLIVNFVDAQRAIDNGQYVVFYVEKNNESICIGGSRIIDKGPSLYQQSLQKQNC